MQATDPLGGVSSAAARVGDPTLTGNPNPGGMSFTSSGPRDVVAQGGTKPPVLLCAKFRVGMVTSLLTK
jgi:hypothetical protein